MPDAIPYKAVKESDFDVELGWEVPWDFWEEEPEPPYEHPAQLKLFRLEPPYRGSWLEQFHHELRKRGWPEQTVEAVYSYFDSPVEDPREGEEEEDPQLLPLMRFRVWILGDWLVEHPDFFTSFDKLAKEGIRIKTDGDEGPYRPVYWRIFRHRGTAQGYGLRRHGIFHRETPARAAASYAGRGLQRMVPGTLSGHPTAPIMVVRNLRQFGFCSERRP